MNQLSIHDIEIKVIVSEPFTEEQEQQFKKLHHKNLGFPFNITITYHDDIPTGATGKFEEFISLVDDVGSYPIL